MKEQSEETPPKVFGTGETPSFDEAWNKAEYYTKLLWTDYGKEYLARAKKSKAFPYLIPRGREQYATHDKFLKGTKLVLTSGRSGKTDFAKEVSKVLEQLQQAKLNELKCMIEGGEISKETRKMAFLHDELPVRNSNYPVFKPLLLEAFMNLYDQHPERKEHLKKAVTGKKGLREDLKNRGQTDKAWLKEIKKCFNLSTKSLAKENSKLLGKN